MPAGAPRLPSAARCPELDADLRGRTAVVTGGNSGIGAATAAALVARGARVVITARDPDRGAAAARRIGGDTEVVPLDLASLRSVRAAASELRDRCPRIDALVLNAGSYLGAYAETEDGHEAMFQVNHLGHFLLAQLLRARLRESAPARVVVVASAAHATARHPLPPEPWRAMDAYASSKLANVLFAREAARRFAGDGIAVNAVHPGTVRSGWGMDGDAGPLLSLGLRIARPFFLSPARGARTVVHLAASPAVEGESGGYWVRCRRREPSAAARDDALAGMLWERSEALVAAADGAP